jgi:hypothetical protein
LSFSSGEVGFELIQLCLQLVLFTDQGVVLHLQVSQHGNLHDPDKLTRREKKNKKRKSAVTADNSIAATFVCTCQLTGKLKLLTNILLNVLNLLPAINLFSDENCRNLWHGGRAKNGDRWDIHLQESFSLGGRLRSLWSAY